MSAPSSNPPLRYQFFSDVINAEPEHAHNTNGYGVVEGTWCRVCKRYVSWRQGSWVWHTRTTYHVDRLLAKCSQENHRTEGFEHIDHTDWEARVHRFILQNGNENSFRD